MIIIIIQVNKNKYQSQNILNFFFNIFNLSGFALDWRWLNQDQCPAEDILAARRGGGGEKGIEEWGVREDQEEEVEEEGSGEGGGRERIRPLN